jgi:probable phosphoglycerate mutase
VLTSPLRRAVQTAEAIAMGRPLHVDRRLREVDFGEAEGLFFAQIARRWPDLAATLASGTVPVAWPGGERWSDVGTRARAVREDLRDLKSNAIIVTHAFTAVALLEGAGVADLSPAGVSIVELDVRAARV